MSLLMPYFAHELGHKQIILDFSGITGAAGFRQCMILCGANVVYVQKQLGHSSIQLTVDTYTHWRADP
jgi:integrase